MHSGVQSSGFLCVCVCVGGEAQEPGKTMRQGHSFAIWKSLGIPDAHDMLLPIVFPEKMLSMM